MAEADKDLKMQIDNLKTVIELEQENYKTALFGQTDLMVLQKMRENIKQLKSHLQLLIEKQSVQETGKLPDEKDKKKKQ